MATSTNKKKKESYKTFQKLSQHTIEVAKNVHVLDLARALGYQSKTSGVNNFICCPVHMEDTPSLNIHNDGFFRCHGSSCGIGGRTIDFFMYHEWGRKDSSYFVEAVKGVCEAMGITIKYEGGSSESLSRCRQNPQPQPSSKQDRVIHPLMKLVYRSFIKQCSLNDQHQKHLIQERKMSKEEFQLREYKSFPEKAYQICKELSNEFSTFEGVPGFIQRQSKFKEGEFYWDVIGAKGILIPIRNEDFEIVGFQNRVDHPQWDCVVKTNFKDRLAADLESKSMLLTIKWDGKVIQQCKIIKPTVIPLQASGGQSLGTVKVKPRNKYKWLASGDQPGGSSAIPHYHVAVPVSWIKKRKTPKKSKTVWVTEGPLKGDLACEYTQCPFISIPGVSQWRLAVQGVLALNPEEVVIAIDADALKDRKTNRQTGETNEDIGSAITGMTEAYIKAGKKVKIAAWKEDEGKGVDDLFQAGKRPQLFEV